MLLVLAAVALAQDPHGVRLVDGSGTPFRCAVLETVHHVRFTTDDTGWAALYEPGLMDTDVWLVPSGPGVVAPVDWLGLEGFRVTLASGGTTVRALVRDGPSPPCGRGDVEQRLFAHGAPKTTEYHELRVTDAATGRPVPAVRILLGGQELWTDNGGRAAWFDIDDMSSPRRAEVWAHGYTHSPGHVDLAPLPSGVTALTVDRTLPAERLIRLTGGGLWRDSTSLGHAALVSEPWLDSQVLGQDTAHVVPWRGGLFWLWGDTNKPSYPLGNFHTTGATSFLDPTPESGIDFDYFEGPDGFVRGIAPTFPSGPVWLGGLVALDDTELWANFVNVEADFSVNHSGMVRWDDATESFLEVFQWPPTHQATPGGPAILADGPGGPWVVYRSLHRVPATPTALADPSRFEAWTPLQPDGSGGFEVEEDVAGTAIWRWRTDAPMPTYQGVGTGEIPREHSPWHQALEPSTGETPVLHQGALQFSPVRGRWLHVFTESFGASSIIGEIWYAEGDTPMGPWSWARKIISHQGYSFYNPYFHPWFAREGGRRVLFEGTYTHWLGTQPATPRHDYNQVLYALQLDDPRLALPVAFYDGPDGPTAGTRLASDLPQAFGALDQEAAGAVALTWTAPACLPRVLEVDGPGEVALWAPPAGTAGPDRVDLHAWTLADGSPAWSIRDLSGSGATRGPALASVWRPRFAPPVPLSQFPTPERADAGPDQCGATSPVALDGSASVLADGITDWSWSWDGGSTAGELATAALPAGQHVIHLTVSGPSGEATDALFVEVAMVATGDTGSAPTGATGLEPPTGDTAVPTPEPTADTGAEPAEDTAATTDTEPPPVDVDEPSGCGCSSGSGGGLRLLALVSARRRAGSPR